MKSTTRQPSAELTPNSSSPLYEQITSSLRQEFIGQKPAGTQLPTEDELVRHFGVSRATIRRAIKQLVAEGLLVRQRGKGTFLARAVPKIIHQIDRVAPFMETFKKLGEGGETRLIRFEWQDEAPDLPPKLHDSWEGPILTYERLYLSRGVPHAITLIHTPYRIGRHLSRDDINRNPIYEALSQKLKTDPVYAEFLVSCRQPQAHISQQLEIAQSSMLLTLERISYDIENTALEHTTHFLRPDVYQLSVRLDDLSTRWRNQRP